MGVDLYTGKYGMKLTKFGILVKKTTYLFPSKEIAIFPGGVGKFWKLQRVGG